MRFQGDIWAKFFYSPSWIIFPMIPSFSRKKHLKAKFKLKHLSYPQQWRTRIIPASASRSRGPVTRSSWHRSRRSRSTRRTWHAMPGFAAGLLVFIDQKHVGGLIHPGRLTAGTYSHHLFLEMKMIWTKPSWGHVPCWSSGVYTKEPVFCWLFQLDEDT